MINETESGIGSGTMNNEELVVRAYEILKILNEKTPIEAAMMLTFISYKVVTRLYKEVRVTKANKYSLDDVLEGYMTEIKKHISIGELLKRELGPKH